MNLLHWQQLLSDRGILAPALEAGWQPNGTGWLYPVTEGLRWKAFDSSHKPKYLWKEGNATTSKYYLLDGALEAIQETGEVYIASGEPDVLTYRAAGILNTLSFFGEGNIPVTLAEDFAEMGITSVTYYIDRDRAGEKSARKVLALLDGKGFTVQIARVPDVLGDKGDINKLWQYCEFDEAKFASLLGDCPWIDLPPEQQPELPTVYNDLPDGFYAAIEQALHVEAYKSDGWSKPIACVLAHHEHDAQRPAAAWHKDKKIYCCFKCGETEVLAKDIGSVLGIDWREYMPKQPARKAKPVVQGSKGTASWNQATDRVVDELFGNVDASIREPLPIPFASLVAMGGLAKMMPPRKMMAIVGDSGDGKSSLIETIVDYWRRLGFSGILFGPEWSKEEVVYRAIQRQGGPTYMQVMEHKAWYAAYKRGIPANNRPGKPLSQELSDLGVTIAEQIRSWPGKLWFVEKMSITVDELMVQMTEIITTAQLQAEFIAFAVVDYAQLLRSGGGVAGTDTALSDFKTFCVDNDLVGVVASQVPKETGKAMMKGDRMTHHAMQFARSDYFNLMLTINRELNEAGEKSPNAMIYVAKNSLGKNGEVRLVFDEKRLLWTDTKQRPN